MSNIDNDDDDDLFEDATEGDVDMADPEPEQEREQEQEIEQELEEQDQEDQYQEDIEPQNEQIQNSEAQHELKSEQSQNQTTSQDGDVLMTEPDKMDLHNKTFRERNPISPVSGTTNCSSYDIVPYVACLHASPVYCVDFSWGLKWMFTGGADGFIRRYNFFDSVNGKLPLTVAQRHPFVDSITKSGVVTSFWENEQPVLEKDAKVGKDGLYEPKVSPVYSLAVQSEAMWLLGGLESGGINLQTVRHNEGQIHAYLDKHKSAVSVLKLDANEQMAISGSWDKTIVEWDLNTGKYTREYLGSSGQIAAMEYQPKGGSLIPQSLTQIKPEREKEKEKEREKEKDDDEKSLDSLFGGEDEDGDGDGSTKDVVDVKREEKDDEYATVAQDDDDASVSDDVGKVETDGSVFMSASFDGVVDIWDRRQEHKTGHLYVPEGTPPWCTSACWSTDGNSIFIGRRNHSVEQYDIRKSLVKPQRTLKFPSVSGAVSTVAALPSGRHILCGSHDNLRLYDLEASTKSKTPFYIIPGHHGAVLSTIYVDPSCQYLVTASGSRGWQGNSTDVALVYEIKPQR